jgi:hypothetical protein
MPAAPGAKSRLAKSRRSNIGVESRWQQQRFLNSRPDIQSFPADRCVAQHASLRINEFGKAYAYRRCSLSVLRSLIPNRPRHVNGIVKNRFAAALGLGRL